MMRETSSINRKIQMNLTKPIALFACLVVTGLSVGFAMKPAMSIEGNYVLDYRELPDGKKVHAPEIVGMLTYTKDRRNFNVYWADAGKGSSISLIAKYTFSESEYSEDNIFYAENMAGSPMVYDIKPSHVKSAVVMKDGHATVKMPLHGEPTMVFGADGNIIASRKDAFVDHWKKLP